MSSIIQPEEVAQIVGQHGNHQGLSLIVASMFIVGEIAGTGILALPQALANTGWSGVIGIAICCIFAAFSGVYLSKSWLMVEEKWPEYSDTKVRSPYATMALKAVGPKTATLATFTMNFQFLGGTVVLLLLSAEMTDSILNQYVHDVRLCEWILIIGFCLLPLTFFGSPVDFWPVAVAAMSATAISSVLLTYAAFSEYDSKADHVYNAPTLSSYMLAMGTMLFTVSGAAALPTFQNDMKDKSQFSFACTVAFGLMFVMYTLVSVAGYLAYGSSVTSNVLKSLPPGPLTTTINVLMILHVICAFLIVMNPLNLSLEDYFRITHSFNWRRSVFRSITCLTSIFICLTVPRFGKILNLIGGSTTSLQTFILPSIFYICLSRQTVGVAVPRHTYVTAAVMAFIGIVAGLSATYFSLFEILAPSAFTPPCYVDECAANKA